MKATEGLPARLPPLGEPASRGAADVHPDEPSLLRLCLETR